MFQHILDGGKGRGTAHGVAAKGGGAQQPGVVNDLLDPQLGLADDAGDGHNAAAKGLAIGHDVGCDPFRLAPPHGAGAAHARLDLVKDQHHAGLVTDLPALLEVALGGHNDPGLPLDGL